MDVLHSAIQVPDLDTADAFYGEFIGLEVHREAEVDGVPNVWYKGEGPAEIQFCEVEDAEIPGGVDHLAFATDDLEGMVERAVDEWDSEIEFEPTEISDGVWIAFISDPFGYSVELIES